MKTFFEYLQDAQAQKNAHVKAQAAQNWVSEDEVEEGVLDKIKSVFGKKQAATAQKGRLYRPNAPIMVPKSHDATKIMSRQNYHHQDDGHDIDPATVPEFKSGPWR